MSEVVVILNPAGGGGRAGNRRGELEAALRRYADGARWEIRETDRRGHATQLAAEAAAAGARVVAAAGGDGTAGEVVNGLVGAAAGFALLPMGTGNDFVRTIGLTGGLDQAAQTLFHGETRPLDLGRAGERYFLNIAGCGFDAVVAERVAHGPRFLNGAAAYLYAVGRSLVSFRAAEMRLTLDGEPLRVRAILCSVANATCYGGGMRIAPHARIDDGLLDVCILEEVGRAEFLRAFPRVFSGSHLSHPRFRTMRARQIRVESAPDLPVLIDGDVVGHTPITFEVVRHALEVMATARPVARP